MGFGRFTPARAGTAYISRYRLRKNSVHPRARGDGLPLMTDVATIGGSPPRARGRRRRRQLKAHVRRFTPARAGTAPPSAPSPAQQAVHPRARGDGAEGLGRHVGGSGSPPRARGRLGPAVRERRRRRFTPARAGTAAHDVAHGQAVAVHPRARGDGW